MLGTDLNAWVEQLRAAGVNAAADPRDLTLPGVWITPNEITFPATLDLAQCTAQWMITVLAGDSNTLTALDELDTQLAALLAAGVLPDDDTIRPVTVQLPSQAADPLIGFQYTTSTTIERTS